MKSRTPILAYADRLTKTARKEETGPAKPLTPGLKGGNGAGIGPAAPALSGQPLKAARIRYQTRCPRKPTRSAFHSSDGTK